LINRSTSAPRRAAFTTITGDALTDPLKARQLSLIRRSLRLGVDVDHVAGLRSLVPADWLCGLQVSQTPEPNGYEPTANGGQRCCQVFGDATHGAAFMVQCPGLLLLPWIERPPLGTANTTSIHQCHCPACAVTSKPLVCAAEADPCLRRQFMKGYALINVSTYK
jgi:hypothetical protein